MLEQLTNTANYHYNLHAIPVVVAGIFIFLIGIFIFFQTQKTIKNISFFLFCLSSSLWLITMGFVYCANDPTIALYWYKHFVFLGVINLMPNLYLFSVTTSGRYDQQRPFVFGAYVFSYSIYVLALTTDKIISLPTLFSWGYYPHYEPLSYIFLLSFLVIFIACQVNLRIAYQREEVPIKKTQISIIIISLLFAITAFVDFIAKVSSVPVYPFGFISMFLLTCILAYSIIRHKAFDIETVIHKTILWMLSFFIIIVPIFLMYRWSFPVIKDSTALQLIFGIAGFSVFALYLRYIQPEIDHAFQRRRTNLEETSNQFIANLVHLKGLDNLVRYIGETIDRTMYSDWIDILIINEEKKKFILTSKSPQKDRAPEIDDENEFLKWLRKNNRIVYGDFVEIDPAYAQIKSSVNDYLNATKATVVIPLVLGDHLLGMINLGKKTNLKQYKPLDFQFLTTLKNQAAIAISNSLIYQNIEEQVKRRTAELVEVQRQLIQVEKLATVGTLSGGVAHEINNPLTAILTSVQMLLATCEGEDAKVDKESLELIEEATQRCRTIVQKLMAYAKKPLESGETSRIDLADVIDTAISFLGYQLEQEDIKIDLKGVNGSYWIAGNHNELEQVMTNIILNARDAIVRAKKDGKICIALSKSGNQFKVDIEDEGEGIPENILSKIFDPFFTTKDVGKGLGLGLSICHSIIEKHRGRITVRSQVGSGTVFTIAIPQYSQEAASRGTASVSPEKNGKEI